MEELWRPVFGFEGRYEVSNIGRVRNCKRGKILSLVCNKRGYMMCNLYPAVGKVKNFLCHRLVARAFIGPIPPGMQVNHINSVRNDNRVENLEIVTRQANLQHAREKGLFRTQKGEANMKAKLTEEEVREIRKLRAEKVTAVKLALQFDVTQGQIYSIEHRRAWAHVE